MAQRPSKLHFTSSPTTKIGPKLECAQWFNEDNNDEEIVHPVLTIAQDMSLKENNDENMINQHISNPYFPQYLGGQSFSQSQISMDHLLRQDFQEESTSE